MRVCYFGGYDRDHPRNRVLIKGLRECGVEVIECHSRHRSKTVRAASLAAQYWKVRRQIDCLVIGASGHTYAPLAWFITRPTATRVVLDAFVSMYEARMDEPAKGLRHFIGCQYGRLMDRLALLFADAVLLDTDEHVRYFIETIGGGTNKVKSVPVGADATAFEQDRALRRVDQLTVMCACSFLPLHGVEVIFEAAVMLKHKPHIRFVMIGGELARRADRPVTDAITFRGAMSYEEYGRDLCRADVALGVLGTTPKANRVIPCKVYDSLAAGVSVITGDTPAIRKLLRHRETALLVPAGNPRALADAILLLDRDPVLRHRIAAAGRQLFVDCASSERLGQQLKQICFVD